MKGWQHLRLPKSGEIVELIYYYGLTEEQYKCLEQIVKTNTALKALPEDSSQFDAHGTLIIPEESVIQRLPLELIQRNPPILCWDRMEHYLLEAAWQAYCNAEQYYLRYALKRAYSPETDTLILGSSYAKYGLSASAIGKSCVNLGLDAQDIFYTCKLGMKVIEHNPNLCHIVLASGYYWFYSDVSRAKSEYARNLIANTYYPVLKDAHHAAGASFTEQCRFLSEELAFLDESSTLTYYCRKFYDSCGGESAKISRTFALKPSGWSICNRYVLKPSGAIGAGEYSWEMLPDAVKDAFAQIRCKDHNKLLRHIESFEENKGILNQFILFCNQKKINVYILCMPQTKAYLRHLDPRFQSDYEMALDEIEGIYHFIDFHEVDMFRAEDYMDQDHLSPLGAAKATTVLEELIDSCRE